ncbi:MAG TPA: PQQ-binding-like beta-propeller repeat protein [Gaiellaceae bacterium]|nr:PQQ-binding-like beta-propeller repeat protein [Gaiellaceae bacterium]
MVAAGALVSCGSSRPRQTSTARPVTVSTTIQPPQPPAPKGATPWPTYGADNARLRSVSAPGLRPPFRRLWTFHGRHLLEFPPVVGYGSVFEEAFDGRLYSLDPATGRVRWSYDSRLCGWSSPALAEHLVFATFIGNAECHAARGGGELVAFSAETGRVQWRRAIGPSESSPLVAGGTVYVGDQDGSVDAFFARAGRLRWSYDTGAPIKASASLAYGRIYVGNYAGAMFALSARTGRLAWRSTGHGNFYSTASVAAGRVYVGSLDGHVYAFSARTGGLLWSFGTGSYVYASPAVWRDLVLLGSYDHGFYALAGATGSLRWSYRARAAISGAASVVDGIVYFSSFDHRTYALAAASGRLRAEWQDGEYSPAVAGIGRLYLVGLGRIYALARR